MVLGLVLYETAELLCTVVSLTVNCVKGATAFGRWWWWCPARAEDQDSKDSEVVDAPNGPAHSDRALLDRIRRLEGRVAELEGEGRGGGRVPTIRGQGSSGDGFEVVDLQAKVKTS